MNVEPNLSYESLPSTNDGSPPPRKKAKYTYDKDPARRDLASLPANVLLTVFSYLDQKSISNCAVLCSTLNDLSKHGSLYKKVELKYNMNSHLLKLLVNKISCPREIYIEYNYKSYDQQSDADDYTEFNKYVGRILRKYGEYITKLKIESCKIEEVLLNISECVNLKCLVLCRSKGSFKTLPMLNKLTNVHLVMCHFPQKVITSNVNVDINEICENMPTHNTKLEIVHLCEQTKLKAKSVKSLAKLKALKELELTTGKYGFRCDPEDSLEQLSAGCTKLECLAIYGWKEVNDDNFIPALHNFTQLKKLDLRGVNITIKSCEQAAITLPLLKTLDIFKCRKIRKAELAQLQKRFRKICIL